jgi:hypothetical protein
MAVSSTIAQSTAISEMKVRRAEALAGLTYRREPDRGENSPVHTVGRAVGSTIVRCNRASLLGKPVPICTSNHLVRPHPPQFRGEVVGHLLLPCLPLRSPQHVVMLALDGCGVCPLCDRSTVGSATGERPSHRAPIPPQSGLQTEKER